MHSFFFGELQIISFTFNSRFLHELKTASLKLCVGFSIFDPVLFLLKFIFLSNKKHELFNFKTV